jgi:hypothetical protein
MWLDPPTARAGSGALALDHFNDPCRDHQRVEGEVQPA